MGIDDKVLAVPLEDPGWNHLEVLEDLAQQLQDEIAHFFSVYKDLEQKQVKVDGWYSREDALTEIAASRQRFRDSLISSIASSREYQPSTLTFFCSRSL